jgi:glycosyltransferase involved in cell wall biosynthesis
MKILVVTPRLPYPPIEGIRIKSNHLIRGLHERGHEIILVAALLDPSDTDPNNIWHVERYVEDLRLIDYASVSPKLLSNMLESLYIPSKELVVRLKVRYAAAYVNKLIYEKRPDIVHYDWIHSLILMGPPKCGLPFRSAPSILSLCDSYSFVLKERIRRGTGISPNSFARWIYALTSFPFALNLEKRLHKMFQLIHVVSKSDAEWLRSLNPLVKPVIIPNGVDIDYFKPMKEVAEKDKTLVMIANFRVDEHVNNAVWFITRIFKKLKKIEPKIKLYLVGKDPPIWLMRLAKSIGDVIITGYVPDIRPYLMQASLVVDARREHYGILNHVLQAMSMGKCIVGTQCSFLAIDGIEPWGNAVIARNEHDFVIKVISLINDRTMREKIGKSARKLIESNYAWQRIILKYEEMYRQAIHDRVSMGRQAI